MAPSSSSTKKLAKVARSGKKRSIRESSDRTYPLAIAAIVILGTLSVFVGRSQRASAQRVEPKLTDHWHAAFGFYGCDSFAKAPADAAGDKFGIHTHEDGIIHIHPFSSAVTGEKSTISHFFDDIGWKVSDKKVVTADGTTYESGKSTCPSGETGKLVLVQWKNADDPAEAPTVIDHDITGTRFVNDRMAFTLAFVPEAKIADIPRPESIPNLDQLTDVTTTTVAGATTTTVAGETTTTAVGNTTTAAGATTTTAAGATTTTGASTGSTTAPGSTTTTG